jgi:hypothetical protein
MYRRLFLMSLLTSCVGCVPIKSTYYVAIDKSRMAAATDENVLPCPPITGYQLGVHGAYLSVNTHDDSGKAHIEVLVYIAQPHQLTFETFELQLSSLSDPTTRSSVPLAFYRFCSWIEPARHCPLENPTDRTLRDPVGVGSSLSEPKLIGIANVPPELVDGFQVTFPAIVDGATTVDTKPLRFRRHTGVLLTGLGGCK